MKVIKSLLMAVVFFVAGFLLGQAYQVPTITNLSPQAGDNSQLSEPVTYLIRFDDNNLTEFQNVSLEGEESVLDVLSRLTENNQIELNTVDYQNLGKMVTAIGESQNGQDDKYWQYYINEEQPQIGAGAYMLTGGELVEWRFAGYNDDQFNN